MQQVHMNKAELKEIIKKNRELHEREYNEALLEWKEAAHRAFVEVTDALHHLNKELMSQGVDMLPKFIEKKYEQSQHVRGNFRQFFPQAPQCYLKNYDVALEMLEHEVNANVTLSLDDYRKFVKDEWDWKETFEATKMSYANFSTVR